MGTPPKIMMVAGEASGDMHGAKLAASLKARRGGAELFGIGGQRMRSAGVRIAVDAHRLSVVGITEVFAKLPRILNGMRTAKRLIIDDRPDLLILIDFPDFNLHLAAFANKHAVPVLYYISPQIWAWRQGRVRKIRRIVDHMAVILPFEEAFYRRYGVPVSFVGHPLMDHYAPPSDSKASPRNEHAVTIGLLPGSRDSEVGKLLPLMLSAAKRIRKQRKVRFLLSQAPSVSPGLVQRLTKDADVPVAVHKEDTGKLLQQATLVIVASGTSTLEAALQGTPMIIVYKVSPLSYKLGRALIRVPHIGLVNLIADKRVAPELIQQEASPDRIAHEATTMLDNPVLLAKTHKELKEVARRLGSAGASDKVAGIAWEMIEKGRSWPPGKSSAKDQHGV